MDFAENAVKQLLAQYPQLATSVKAHELKDELHDEFVNAPDHMKKQALHYGPIHFVTEYAKKTAKWAMVAAAVLHGAAEIQATQEDLVDAQADGTEQGDGGMDVDATAARKRYDVKEQEETPDGKKPVPPPEPKPLSHEEIKRLTAIWECTEGLIKRWFEIHHEEVKLSAFGANIEKCMNAVTQSKANAPHGRGGPDAYFDMCEGLWDGKSGAMRIFEKFAKIKETLLKKENRSPSQERGR